MTLTLVFLTALAAFILNKISAISKRQHLSPQTEKRLLVSGILTILFIVTNATLPYPQSLYWFIVFATMTVVAALSLDVLKKELSRFKLMPLKQQLLNVAFYSLLATVTFIFV